MMCVEPSHSTRQDEQSEEVWESEGGPVQETEED